MFGLDSILKTALPLLKTEMKKNNTKAYILTLDENENPEIFAKAFNPEKALKEMYLKIQHLEAENKHLKNILENGK